MMNKIVVLISLIVFTIIDVSISIKVTSFPSDKYLNPSMLDDKSSLELPNLEYEINMLKSQAKSMRFQDGSTKSSTTTQSSSSSSSSVPTTSEDSSADDVINAAKTASAGSKNTNTTSSDEDSIDTSDERVKPTQLSPCIPKGHSIESVTPFLKSLPNEVGVFITSLKPCGENMKTCRPKNLVFKKSFSDIMPTWLKNAPVCPVSADIKTTSSTKSSVGAIIPDYSNSTFNKDNPSQNTPNIVSAALGSLREQKEAKPNQPENKILDWGTEEITRIENENTVKGPVLKPNQKILEYNHMKKETGDRESLTNAEKAATTQRINEIRTSLKGLHEKSRRAAAHVTFLRNTSSIVSHHIDELTKRLNTMTNATTSQLLSEEWKHMQSNLRLKHQKQLLNAVKAAHRSVNNTYRELMDLSSELHMLPKDVSTWDIQDFANKKSNLESQLSQSKKQEKSTTEKVENGMFDINKYENTKTQAQNRLKKLQEDITKARAKRLQAKHALASKK